MPLSPVVAPNGIDRRKHERIAARVEVRFAEREHAQRAFKAFSLNFSVGGVCLKTDRVYEIGSQLSLTIQVGEEQHALNGVVAWVRSGAVGVRFDISGDADRMAVARIMNSVRR